MPQSLNPNLSTVQLHEILHRESDAIFRDWEQLDRETLQSARALSSKDLIDNVPTILNSIAEHARRAEAAENSISRLSQEGARIHAEQRWKLGFTLEEVTREYGMLRTIITQKLAPDIHNLSTDQLVFLYESLDEAVVESVVTYVATSNQTLEAERERLQVTLKSIGEGVVSTDPNNRILYLNAAAEKIIGWTQKESLGRPINEVVCALDEATGEPVKCLTLIATETGERSEHPTEILLKHRDGQLIAAEEVAAPLWDSSGNFLGAVTTFRDVSKVRALTVELGYLAAHDPLTGLPNRSLLTDRLTQKIAQAERHRDRLALLYLDLDLFKDVNDMLGHTAGDELLKQAAQRLENCVRKTDTVCRVGGDEFVILLSEFGALEYLNDLGEKITEQMRQPYTIGTDTVDISTSVGVSIFPEDGRDPQTLVKHADIAMYQAKQRGRNDVQFFAPEMNKRAVERRKLQGDLRNALSAGELSLRFQPQFALASGDLVGAEVLMRWHHPKLGYIPPGRFIPVAEDNREIMSSIGDWALEEACRQARQWMDEGYPPLRISVNVSQVQLRNGSFVSYVGEVLSRYGLPADQLQLELTESLLMSDVSGAAERIRLLEFMGVRIAVDDFGTGYSSLSYLKNLPVDELKIDQSFVRNIRADVGNAPIVQAIIRMGQSLNLRVVAEGVEDQGAVDFLTDNSCESAQGFFYSEAVSAKTFEDKFLHSSH